MSPKSNPVNKCVVCGKPITKMVRVRVWNGYYLQWSKAKYCSQTCIMRAYRRRVKKRRLSGAL